MIKSEHRTKMDVSDSDGESFPPVASQKALTSYR